MKLNEDAKTVLRDAGVSQAAWARANWSADGKWSGDACGCPDDRCKDGFHHYPDDECGCLRTLLESYLAGEGTFAEYPAGAIERRAVRLLERVLFLRQNGERPPGGNEDWAPLDRDIERFLRSLPPPEQVD